METLYALGSSVVTALLFTAGWSVAVGRRLQMIDDLKAGFSRMEANMIRIEGDMKRLEESITKLIDHIAKLEGKVDGIVAKGQL
jgi:phage-related protein